MALGDLRPGSLSEQYNVCGTADANARLIARASTGRTTK
jgi:hypothetical protein